MKRCSKCHIELPLDSFSPSKRGKYGRASVCKRCCAAHANAYYHQHVEMIRAKENARRAANPLPHRESNARHRRSDPERHSEYKAVQKARRRTGVAGFTSEDWHTIKAHYGFTCLACGRPEPEIKLCVDHVVPVSRGGGTGIDNIQPLCIACNSHKHAKVIDYRPTL